VSLLNFWIFIFTVNIIFSVAYVALKMSSGFFDCLKIKANAHQWLKTHNLFAIIGILTAVVISFTMPSMGGFDPPFKIWAELATDDSRAIQVPISRYLVVPVANYTIGLSSLTHSSNIALTLFILGLMVLTFQLVRDFRIIKKIKSESYLYRKISGLQIFIHPNLAAPFSSWTPLKAYIFIPQTLLTNTADFRMSLLHELQHHRNADTRWSHLWLGLRTFMFYNPFVYFWSRWISELQEIACDSTMVNNKKMNREQYSRCLLEAAKKQLLKNQRTMPRAAWALGFLGHQTLKRRIKIMFERNIKTYRSVPFFSAAFALALSMGSAALAKQALQDQRINLEQAQEMLQIAKQRSTSEFPIVLNERVLRQLNRLAGTPQGKRYMSDSFEQMSLYEEMIYKHIEQYKLPTELAAIPIIESGYRNLPESNRIGWGAGLWMFIKTTARSYGLKVDTQVDERLNEPKLTDAAMRMLKAEYLTFNDWQLALLAYNVGGTKVAKTIKKVGSRNAWDLIDAGIENDKDYLAKVMAAILIMNSRPL
jgi:membrane-bound lytic murein transglycosylase D